MGCAMFPPFATVEAIVGFRTPNETGKINPWKTVPEVLKHEINSLKTGD